MKVLYLILLLQVIHLSSTSSITSRNLLGTEPYIPYHHICVKSCWDSFDNSIDLRIKWSCCDRGWDKCCASSIIQIPNTDSLSNPYEATHLFDSFRQNSLNLHNFNYPTHSHHSNSNLKLVLNPFYRIPQNTHVSHSNQSLSQTSDNSRVHPNSTSRIINFLNSDRKNQNNSNLITEVNLNNTSPVFPLINANKSFIESKNVSNNSTELMAIV